MEQENWPSPSHTNLVFVSTCSSSLTNYLCKLKKQMTKVTFKAALWGPYKTNSSGCLWGLNFFFFLFFTALSRVYFSCQKPTAHDYGADNYKEEVISLKKKSKERLDVYGCKRFFGFKTRFKTRFYYAVILS